MPLASLSNALNNNLTWIWNLIYIRFRDFVSWDSFGPTNIRIQICMIQACQQTSSSCKCMYHIKIKWYWLMQTVYRSSTKFSFYFNHLLWYLIGIYFAKITLFVHFNSLFTEMFRTSLWTWEVRCEVQKFIMKFTNQFVKLAFDWLLSNV